MPHRSVVTGAVFQSPAPYSLATVPTNGQIVHIAGQVPQDASGKTVGIGDIDVQVDKVLANIKALVEAEGGTMADIFRIAVFTTDRAYLPNIAAARRRYFSAPYPINTALIVSGLNESDWLVEIEATACIAQ